VKKIALYAALIMGAVSFDVDTQELASDSQLPVAPALKPVEPDQNATADKVTQALKDAKEVPDTDITVSTHAGTIILTGEVDTEVERTAAKSVAEMAAAGSRVSSSIEVRPPEDRSPEVRKVEQHSALVVSDVEAALQADARTKNLGVAVTSTDGHIVVLQGLVATPAIRATVESVAAKVKGVMRIDNRLQAPGS